MIEVSGPASGSKASLTCATLFALPFLAGGLLTVGLAFLHFTGLRPVGSGSSGAPFGLLLFGVVFTGAGTAVILGARYAARKSAELLARQNAYPGSPWMWREDWAAGRLPSGSRGGAIALLVFGLLWTAISSPVVFLLPKEIAKGNMVALVGFIFPVVGIGLLSGAAVALARARRFGGSTLEMRVPARPGGRLEGTVESGTPLPSGTKVRISVSGIRRTVSRSGKNSSVREDVLFREEWVVEPQELSIGPVGTRIPISMPIAADAPETSPNFTGNDRILWRVTAASEIEGPDFSVQFEIPVFRTPGDPEAEAGRSFRPAPAADSHFAPVAPGPESGLSVDISPEGGTRFRVAPARNAGTAFGLFVFAAVWGAISAILVRVDAPRLLAWGFVAIDAILVLAFLQTVFGRRTVTFLPDLVRIDGLFLGLGRNELPPGEIEAVDLRIGMQSGTATFHDVRFLRRGRRPVTAIPSIREKSHARWIGTEMARLLGVPFRS